MEPTEWNAAIRLLPGATFLQTDQWARIKAPLGWSPDWLTWPEDGVSIESAAMLLTRQAGRVPLSIAYAPRGPLVDWTDPSKYKKVLSDLITAARRKGAIFLKIDPDLTVGRGIPGTPSKIPDETGVSVQQYLRQSGWRFSPDQIQFRNTVEIDLSPSEEDLLMRMHQKTRYNIRLAEKKGVTVSEASNQEWDVIYRLYAETAARDNFVIRPMDYYRQVWSILTEGRMATCLKAEVDGTLVGAIWVITFGKKSHYLYGMSSSLHRDYMPNHLLQWRGMLLAKSLGCSVYDMWGAPDDFTDQDRLSGVFRFKQGFGGEVVRTIGAWDYPIQPVVYSAYTKILPRILDLMRRRSREKTKALLAN